MAELRIRSLTARERDAARWAAEDAIQKVREIEARHTCSNCGARVIPPDPSARDMPPLDEVPLLGALRYCGRLFAWDRDQPPRGFDGHVEPGRHAIYQEHVCPEEPKS